MGKLSVIMPAYNEHSTIAEAVEQSLSVDVGDIEIELVVVDDGSDDGTSDILRSLEPRHNLKVIHHSDNQGKGAAIRTALPHASGDLVIIEDADLELDPGVYPILIEPILNDDADVVFGSRFKGHVKGMTFFSRLGNRVVSLITSVLFGRWVSDEATCYKVFRTGILRSFDLKCKGFEFCPEVTAKTLKGPYRYVEVPVNYWGRDKSSGKKVKMWDGFHAIWTLVKYRFTD